MKKKSQNIAIIGGGASGLVAGVLLAREGKDVTIFEKNPKLGRKILASGNGRCNVTNETISPAFYHGQNANFTRPILENFQTKECIEFFRSIGIELVKKPTGRYYPMSNQASSIVEALHYELKALGAKLYLDSQVEKVFTCKDGFSLHVKNKMHNFTTLLIATGGISMKKLGSSESGYEFAKSFGHTITATSPSLVQLITKENTKEIAGVKLEGSIKIANSEISSYGDILFATYGISGSATLDISRYVVPNSNIDVMIDCMPNLSKEALFNMFERSAKVSLDKPLSLWLNGFINRKLANFILRRCKIEHEKSANLITKKEINALCFTLKQLRFTVVDTKGFEFAEVTAGGVSTDEINAHTLESKLVKNLYFLGEVLDVDGDCGGYNLHFAWGCGHLVARALR